MNRTNGAHPRFEQRAAQQEPEPLPRRLGGGSPKINPKINPKIVGIIQARTGSTRLPGKVLLPILGRPVLSWMLERVAAARELDELVVATTSLVEDEPIRAL